MNSIHAPHTPATRRLAMLLLTLGVISSLPGCGLPPVVRPPNAREAVQAELQASRNPVAAPTASTTASPVQPEAAPPPAAPRADAAPEPRFDLSVSGAAARDVFLSMVTDTRYSMLMHPEVTGTLSVTLRGVTVREALESIRDVYGYEFKIEGRRITVFPATMQTRIFMANYLQAKRQGRSDTRVSSGAAPTNGPTGSSNGTVTPAPGGETLDSSQVSTTSASDIWSETTEALRSIVGTGNGRNVITSPQSGTIAVRAMPEELRQVENYLRASRLALERQVMLEAKIVEVELREGYQSGIDWSLRGAHRGSHRPDQRQSVHPEQQQHHQPARQQFTRPADACPQRCHRKARTGQTLIPLPSAGSRHASAWRSTRGGFQALLELHRDATATRRSFPARASRR